MSTPRFPLHLVSPLPPARNGIADYAHALLGGLADHYACTAWCEDPGARAPEGVPVQDAGQAARRIRPADRVLHQLGNNIQHGFVLRALRRLPGVVTLHDPGLLWLLQQMGEDRATIVAGMRATAPRLAETHGRHYAEGFESLADHRLFDMLPEVLARARAVVVHSRFAAARLRLLHGEAATRHVAVIPHPLPAAAPPERAAARAALGLRQDAFIIVTAGFASRAKRFDWLLPALEHLAGQGVAFLYRHAGGDDAAEFPLAARLAASPLLRGRSRVTGYLEEAALEAHLAAADVLVGLRFPSAGESSGVVARALAAGTACLLTDTAGYAELPRDAVLHLPVLGAVPALSAALAALAREPGLARGIGAAGQRHARAEMALPVVAARYRDVIEDSLDRPVPPPPPPQPAPGLLLVVEAAAVTPGGLVRLLAGRRGACRLLLACADLPELATLTLHQPGLLRGLLPPEARLRDLRVLEAPPRAGLLLALDLP